MGGGFAAKPIAGDATGGGGFAVEAILGGVIVAGVGRLKEVCDAPFGIGDENAEPLPRPVVGWPY